jgi:3'-phosphoadenosine 5'-phosphosulfate sulfotransferase (PAPS reductase)/FAD synthetase
MEQDLVWLEPLSPNEIIEDELVKKKKIDKFYVLYSGGQDSSCVDNFCATEYPEYYQGRVFTNTGISSQITRKFGYCENSRHEDDENQQKENLSLVLIYDEESNEFKGE